MGGDLGDMGEKPTVVVILGATGAGKSRLAIDLACKFSGEVINADSMQVYKGLDILTNKVPLQERREIPHHLLGLVEPNEEFTVKQFRDLAIAIIDDILLREKLPIVVGGTNYYIQALVSSYLLDDFLKESHMKAEEQCVSRHWTHHDDGCQETEQDMPISLSLKVCNKRGMAEACFDDLSQDDRGNSKYCETIIKQETSDLYEHLKMIDQEAACGIHPNNARKLNQYISLYKRTGRKPTELLDTDRLDKWGTADTFRYNCCFICLDAELNILDRFVEQRVDAMMQAGLLDEVSEFYAPGADFTRGLHQAIGVPEFSSLFNNISCQVQDEYSPKSIHRVSTFKKLMKACVEGQEYTTIFSQAVEKMKSNTRRLVRIQKRRFKRLETQFGWHLHRIDVTDVLRSSGCLTDDIWSRQVVCPSLNIVEQFLKMPLKNTSLSFKQQIKSSMTDQTQSRKQFICEVCNSRIFIGLYQWQEHIKGRGHRKRAASVKKLSTVQT